MMDLSEEQKRNLRDDWGDEAKHSEFKPGDILRYRADGSTWSGVIVWIAAQSDSTVEGRDPLPMRYIVERHGFNDSIPDVVYSKDILSAEAEPEPTLEKCLHCGGHHFKGMMRYCPNNPNKP